jgi:hypothetical protein
MPCPIKSLLAPNNAGYADGAPRPPSTLSLFIHLIATVCLSIALTIEAWSFLASEQHGCGTHDRPSQTQQIARPRESDAIGGKATTGSNIT